MSLRFALPAGAAEPRRIERWVYDRDTGQVRNDRDDMVAYVAASRMDSLDVQGGTGRAARTGCLAASAPDMLAALKDAIRAIASMGSDLEVAAPESINANTYGDELRRLRAVVAKAEGRS